MTRREIENRYTVENGIIQSLGKFQGEPVYTVYFYELTMLSCEDDIVGPISFFRIDPEIVAEFPELADEYGVAIESDNNGFVHHQTFNTEAAYSVTLRQAYLEHSPDDDEPDTRDTVTIDTQVLENAQAAFWQVIAQAFPAVTTGDFPPDASATFDAAIKQAVTTWLEFNKEQPA